MSGGAGFFRETRARAVVPTQRGWAADSRHRSIDGGAANGSGVPTDDGVTTFMEAMNRDPRVADVYRLHLEIARILNAADMQERLGKLGLEGMQRLRSRVVAELTTTFASHYTDEVSLAGALALDAIAVYARQATGQKFLIRPSLP